MLLIIPVFRVYSKWEALEKRPNKTRRREEVSLLAVAANLITDFHDTGYNVMGLLLEMAREGYGLGYLDRSVLHCALH